MMSSNGSRAALIAWIFAAFFSVAPPGAAGAAWERPTLRAPLSSVLETQNPGEDDVARLLPLARERELNRDGSLKDSEERLELWKMILLIDPGHLEARVGFQEARGDVDAARQEEEAVRDSQNEAQQEQAELLRRAESALYGGDLDEAQALADDALSADPSDLRAQSLLRSVQAARGVKVEQRRALIIGLFSLLVGLLLAVFLFLRWKRRAAEPQQRGAMVRVVGGVGRGMLKPLTTSVFRIGAAESADDARHNDLVISDDGCLVSRFHCEILQQGRTYRLMDSSLNGTWVNGKRVPSGEQIRLKNGDDVVIAGVSQLRFMTQ